MSDPHISGAATASDSLIGMTIGRFLIKERLGLGGMGEVYRAEDTVLKRSVALKRIARQFRAENKYRERFLKEAERASSLSDQHIGAIYDVLEQQGEMFLVMEFVQGESLRKCMARPFSAEEFFNLATQCALALAAAHERAKSAGGRAEEHGCTVRSLASVHSPGR